MPTLSAAKTRSDLQNDFIYNADFALLRDEEMFSESRASNQAQLDLALADSRTARSMPVHLLRMCEAPLLTPELETQLFRRMNFARYRAAQLRESLRGGKGTRAKRTALVDMEERATNDRNHIVRANLRLVISIAKKFADLRNPFEDLLSEGISALMRAVDKFDYSRGFRFSTYATQAVRRTLYRQVMDKRLDQSRFVSAESSQFEEEHEQEVGTMTEARWSALQSALLRMLGQLDSRERLVIRHRFGLDEQREVTTLQALAKELGVCKERVRQIEQRAIGKLREMAEAIELSPTE